MRGYPRSKLFVNELLFLVYEWQFSFVFIFETDFGLVLSIDFKVLLPDSGIPICSVFITHVYNLPYRSIRQQVFNSCWIVFYEVPVPARIVPMLPLESGAI